jgi:hypothetical protein
MNQGIAPEGVRPAAQMATTLLLSVCYTKRAVDSLQVLMGSISKGDGRRTADEQTDSRRPDVGIE